MSTVAASAVPSTRHPVELDVQPALDQRNRLTSAFRLLLVLPHLLLVGGPVAGAITWSWPRASGNGYEGGFAGGALGAVALLAALIGWFAIVFTGLYPDGLWKLAAYYLRWRVNAIAYTALLRDEYPPFGEGPYPVTLVLQRPTVPRDRLTVAFRIILAIPHLVVIWALGVAWAIATMIAWFNILFTGRYPASLYSFAVGVLRWTTRVEAYLLLLHDAYPPFSLT